MPEEQIPAGEISELVDRFYATVRVDPEIGPIFNATIDDWPAHLALLKNFWTTVLLSERSYKGDPLSKHLPLSLDPPHFARRLALFEQTAREIMRPGHADVIIDKSHRIAQNFQAAIAYHREGTTIEQSVYRSCLAFGTAEAQTFQDSGVDEPPTKEEVRDPLSASAPMRRVSGPVP